MTYCISTSWFLEQEPIRWATLANTQPSFPPDTVGEEMEKSILIRYYAFFDNTVRSIYL